MAREKPFSLLDHMFGREGLGRGGRSLHKVRRALKARWQDTIRYVDPFANGGALDHFPALARYRGSYFHQKLASDDVAFLKGERMFADSLASPGDVVPVTAEASLGRFELTFFMDGDDPLLAIRTGLSCLGIFNFRTSVFLFTHEYRVQIDRLLVRILSTLAAKAASYDTLFGPLDDAAPRVIALGDDRLTHFLRQTMGFLHGHMDADVAPFLAKGGEAWIIRDGCFVDPAHVFPGLRDGRLTYLDFADANLAFDRGVRLMRKIYRGLDDTLDWLPAADSDHEAPGDATLRCLICLDAEKERFRNQTPCLVEVLKHLSATAESLGRRLEIVWDGWTLTPFDADENDRAMVAQLDLTAAGVEVPAGCRSRTIFGQGLLEKLPAIRSCDLALATHGSAALAPCRICKVPTVTYQVADRMVATENVDPAAHFPVEPHYIADVRLSPGDRPAFAVDPRGIIEASERALERAPACSAAAKG